MTYTHESATEMPDRYHWDKVRMLWICTECLPDPVYLDSVKALVQHNREHNPPSTPPPPHRPSHL